MSKAKETAEYLDGSFTLFSPQSQTFNANLADKLTEASNELRRLSDLNEKMLKALQDVKEAVIGKDPRFPRQPDSDGYFSEPLHKDEVYAILDVIKKAKEQE